METSRIGRCLVVGLTVLLLGFRHCSAGFQNVGQISPGLQGTQMNWVDHDGMFLRSNNSEFGFGFTNPQEATEYFLAIIHLSTSKIVWTANQASPVTTSDKFVFDEKGNVVLYHETNVVWSTNTTNKGVSALALMDSGNLALLGSGEDKAVIWESFGNPTDTLLSNQRFGEGMRLVSKPDSNNLIYFLELKSGDMILSVGFKTPQSYWSMRKENRRTINKDGGSVVSATLTANSWNFHGGNDNLLWQFAFSTDTDANATWIAVLGSDGFVSFFKLQNRGDSGDASSIRIPEDHCGTPEPCGSSNFICYSEKKCLCPSILGSRPNCQTGFPSSPCEQQQSIESAELVEFRDEIGYFALQFTQPNLKTDLESCKSACGSNCSCIALFFQASSGACFLFDDIGGFQNSKNSEFVSYIKLSKNEENGENNGGKGKKPIAVILGIAFATSIVISGLIYIGIRQITKKNKFPEPTQENSDEDNFLEGLSGAPIRYSFKDLQTATDNFLVKLGQGGFGSVYRGVLPDGTRIAVKKLEGIGQGKKEFRAEVGIIGSIHHIHLVRLKGFCAEGTIVFWLTNSWRMGHSTNGFSTKTNPNSRWIGTQDSTSR